MIYSNPIALIFKTFHGIVLFAVIGIFVSCANIVTPSGGPKDVAPPEFVKSEPPQYSRNFEGDKIKITFNEFVQLKNINDQIIISPPMSVMPDFRLKGKSVLIVLNEKLNKNSTYNLFFGDAIVDLTENNPFTNFQFIFSTGDVIDSLTIEGQIYNAPDLKPVKGVNIGLYPKGNDTIPFDSLPYFVKPYYLTKTDELGNFKLRNLSDKAYLLFALSDMNSNMIFDQPNESIAFLDSLITPQYIMQQKSDSIAEDSIIVSIPVSGTKPPAPMKMALFQEIDSVQKLLKVFVPRDYQINFIFKRPVEEFQVEPLNLETPDNWSILEYNASKDTITCWVNNTGQDSMKLIVKENNIIPDTLNLALVKRTKGKKQEIKEIVTNKLILKSNLKGNSIDLNKPVIFTSLYPLKSVDTAHIKLLENDTVPVNPFYSFPDSVNRKFMIEYQWKKSTPYSFIFYDSTFIDIHGAVNDSSSFRFTSKSPEDYGNFIIQFMPSVSSLNYIVQLLAGETIIRETSVVGENKINFTYLPPGKYTLKVIYDANSNQKWDTGDYIYKIQPEKVAIFPSEISIRANWDVEEVWELE